MIPQQTIDRVIETIAGKYRPQKIILFGSHASGNPGRGSDLDLFVIKETAVPPRKRAQEIHGYFVGDYPCAMDILVYTPAEVEHWKDCKFSFVHRVLKTGTVIYAENSVN